MLKNPKKFSKNLTINEYILNLFDCRFRRHVKTYKLPKKTVTDYLSCDIVTFRNHIESTFPKNTKFSWKKYAIIWTINFIVPLKYKHNGVDPTTEDILNRLKYTNLRAKLLPEKTEYPKKKINAILDQYEKGIFVNLND